MGQATFSNNTTIKVSGGERTLSATVSAWAYYTIPANSYMIFTGYSSSNLLNFQIRTSSGTALVSQTGATYITSTPIYIGAGSSIAFQAGFPSGSVTMMCIEFTNTP